MPWWPGEASHLVGRRGGPGEMMMRKGEDHGPLQNVTAQTQLYFRHKPDHDCYDRPHDMTSSRSTPAAMNHCSCRHAQHKPLKGKTDKAQIAMDPNPTTCS